MTGLDHIDLKECEKRGIKVISLQGETQFLREVTSTAEHTIGLMIALLRNYLVALSGPWLLRDAYIGHKLKGKKICLIGGQGRIGTQVCKVVEALGMRPYLFDIVYEEPFWLQWFGKITGLEDEEDTLIDRLNDVLSRSDIVSIHIPLSGNEGFFTREMFEQMKNNAYFINTSRSKVVEDGALIYALKNKLIAGAAVDFTDDPELVKYAAESDNLILTNHIGGVTHEDWALTEKFIIKKIDEYMEKNDV